MKHLAKIAGGLIAMLLLFGSVQAWAAGTTQDREFNHMSTGFPLAGVHATTSCESCHVGGVFVGTPRACDGCHATGKRIVATPKSTKHIVTDAPCETCHFNTSTFFGARYNHGTAVPGQCENCHNGRITQGKPTSHPVTIYPCDNCHRSSSWLPASWNHRDTASDCVTCHNAAGPGRNYSTTARHNVYTTLSILTPCKGCHTNYYTFYSYRYGHTDAAGSATACGNCHANAARAAGVVQAASAIHTSATTLGISACQSCHTGYATFFGARYKHADNVLLGDTAYSTKMAVNSCGGCHSAGALTGVTQMTSTAKHAVYDAAYTAAGLAIAGIAPCASCHTNTSTWVGAHHGSMTNCTTCHQGHSVWNTYIRQMSATHIPFDAAVTNCTVCHTSSAAWASVARGGTLHTYVQANATTILGCYTCHGSNTAYPGNGQQTARWPSFHESSKNPAATDCSAGGCHAPAGPKGTAYVRWH